MKTSTILLNVRELLARPNGWCKRNMRQLDLNGEYSYCIVGALYECVKSKRSKRSKRIYTVTDTCTANQYCNLKVANAAAHYLRMGLMPGCYSLSRFNDMVNRTQLEVVEFVEKAIVRALEHEKQI